MAGDSREVAARYGPRADGAITFDIGQQPAGYGVLVFNSTRSGQSGPEPFAPRS